LEETPIWLIALIFALFVVFPMGILFLGLRQIMNVYQFRKNAIRVTGTVVDIKETTTQNENTITTSYQPTFEFTGPNDTLHRGDTLLATANYNFERDSQHAILVNLSEPGTVHMPGNWPYIIGTAMVVSGGVMAYFGSGALSVSG